MDPRGPELNWNKIQNFFQEFGPLYVKLLHHMFSSMKMAEYMKSELSGIFQGKLVMKSMLLVSPGTHFMHMRVKRYNCHV